MPKRTEINLNIRPTILLLFFFIIGIITASIIFMQFLSSQELAQKATLDSFKNVSKTVVNEIKNYDSKSEQAIEIVNVIENANDLPHPNIKHTLLDVLTKNIEFTPFVYSFYVGHANGDFYQIINLNITPNIKDKLKAPKDARWMVVKIKDAKVKYKELIDENLNLITFERTNTDYKAFLRPWYKKSIYRDVTTKTLPYKFTSLQALGVTYSKKLSKTSVIGLDVALESLNTVLAKQNLPKGSKSYLFREDGEITASNTHEENSNIFKLYPNLLDVTLSSKETRIVEFEGKKYFKYFKKLDSKYDYNEYITILSPMDEIMAPYTKKIYTALYITLFIFIFVAIPLILYAVKLIVKPIQAMEKENEKIKDRKFDEVKHIPTFITELDNLSVSLLSMTKSIKEYELSQKELMNSFIKLIASTIDAKSKYTGGHCSRVPELSIALMQKASDAKHGEFKDFTITSEEQLEELNISAWLHDCGKVTTPEHVVDKATKLETIYNRIHEIRARFEILYRDNIIKALKKELDGEDKTLVKEWLEKEQAILKEEFEFIATANVGDEFMRDEDKDRVKIIAKKEWSRYFDNTLGLSKDELSRMPKTKAALPAKEYLLEDKNSHIIPRIYFDYEEYKKMGFKLDVPKDLYNHGEVYNLCIGRGTLTNEERFKINEHVIMSIKMLESLPFPEYLKNVPLYAGAHHETLVGTGYPRKLTKEQMPLASRIIALADVFEALTAADRPYKDAKTLSTAIKILSFMVKDKHIDEDLFKLFLSSGAYLDYAKKYLKPEQIDEVDIDKYL